MASSLLLCLLKYDLFIAKKTCFYHYISPGYGVFFRVLIFLKNGIVLPGSIFLKKTIGSNVIK